MLLGQLLKPLLQGSHPLSLLQVLLRGGAGVGQLLGQREALLIVQRGISPPLFLPAKQVQTGVVGEAVEPGGKAALPAEGGQGPPCLPKDLLGHVGGVLPVAHQAQGLVVDHRLISLHQVGEGLGISLGGLADPLLFFHIPHLLRGNLLLHQHRSRRMPAVTL